MYVTGDTNSHYITGDINKSNLRHRPYLVTKHPVNIGQDIAVYRRLQLFWKLSWDKTPK